MRRADSPSGGAQLRARARGVTGARVAVAVTFFVNGALIGTWAARIPAIKAHLGLDAPQLGLALLGPALGSLAGIPLAGALVARRGSRPVTRMAVFAHCAALPLAGRSEEHTSELQSP